LSDYDASILKKTFLEMSNNNFSVDTSLSTLALLSQFGARQLPTTANLKSLVISIQKHEFRVKLLGALRYE